MRCLKVQCNCYRCDNKKSSLQHEYVRVFHNLEELPVRLHGSREPVNGFVSVRCVVVAVTFRLGQLPDVASARKRKQTAGCAGFKADQDDAEGVRVEDSG